MPSDKVEMRGLAPAELAQALDAIAHTWGMDRNTLNIKVLSKFVQETAHRSKLLQSMARGNPLLSEPEVPATDWGDLK
ncbi:hypothetical protein [Variovorax sp. WS11]|uniref:hypothetical protein n=1 Tax=Variovorax sp. WS11 TaxID=1105204 RepID=UPI0011B28FDA|nr:hypothetical protein [Variovorax sp. WS11]NDZ12068.1 hypothetical protein [Variovorax sp. WS11]